MKVLKKKTNKISIPFFLENVENGKMLLVEGSINNSKGFFILDTGACCSIIDSTLISDFNSEQTHFSSWQIKTIEGNNTNVYAVLIEKFVLNETQFPDKNFFCTSLHFLNKEFPKKPILGIIANDIFEKYSAVIDYSTKEMTIKIPAN
ncbi:MAG: hypothetical protein JXR58_10755 [Bacteroidales bacterium]|nr:hypothetical protein [Bacteroidales bacterium]